MKLRFVAASQTKHYLLSPGAELSSAKKLRLGCWYQRECYLWQSNTALWAKPGRTHVTWLSKDRLMVGNWRGVIQNIPPPPLPVDWGGHISKDDRRRFIWLGLILSIRFGTEREERWSQIYGEEKEADPRLMLLILAEGEFGYDRGFLSLAENKTKIYFIFCFF